MSVFSQDTRKYGPVKTPYLDTFYAVSAVTKSLHRYFVMLEFTNIFTSVYLKTHFLKFSFAIG